MHIFLITRDADSDKGLFFSTREFVRFVQSCPDFNSVSFPSFLRRIDKLIDLYWNFMSRYNVHLRDLQYLVQNMENHSLSDIHQSLV